MAEMRYDLHWKACPTCHGMSVQEIYEAGKWYGLKANFCRVRNETVRGWLSGCSLSYYPSKPRTDKVKCGCCGEEFDRFCVVEKVNKKRKRKNSPKPRRPWRGDGNVDHYDSWGGHNKKIKELDAEEWEQIREIELED